MLEYLYDKKGVALGYIAGNYIYRIDGTAVGQRRGNHVYNLRGEYVGELYKGLVVDKSLIMGKLLEKPKPRRVKVPRKGARRIPIKPPYPEIFNRLDHTEET